MLRISLLPAPLDSFALAAARSSRTATLQTRTAATETTQTLTRVMVKNMASKLLPLSTAFLGNEWGYLQFKLCCQGLE